MKKMLTILMLLLLAVSMAVPAFADDNSHQIAQVLEITPGAVEGQVLKCNHLKEAELLQILEEFRATEQAREVLPEDAVITRMTMVRQREITNNNEPIEISLRAWGAGESWHLLMLFKALGEETWTILSVAQGQYIDAVLPGDGEYALAWSWA